VVGVKGMILLDDLFGLQTRRITWIAVDIPTYTYTFTALVIPVWCELDLDH
jgi:hypothetical protein